MGVEMIIKILLTTLSLVFFSAAIASGTTTRAPSTNTEPLMVFQVIQNQLIIDKTMIESATILSPVNTTDSYGLHLKLNDTGAKALGRISEENIGKKMNMILNGTVISSPTIQSKLGAEFQMYGLSKKQAKQFIKILKL